MVRKLILRVGIGPKEGKMTNNVKEGVIMTGYQKYRLRLSRSPYTDIKISIRIGKIKKVVENKNQLNQ
jgi:hypothetical protein